MTLPLSKPSRESRGIPKVSEDSFEDHFLRYWEGVHRLLQRLLGDSDEAEDLALESFLKLYQKPPRSQNQSEIRAWLYRVATNLGYNALRSRRRRQYYELRGGVRDYHANQSPDPAVEFQRIEDQERVREVLGEMKRRQAQILALRYSGFSYAEIAEILQVSPNSVGQLLARSETEFQLRYRKLEGKQNDSSK